MDGTREKYRPPTFQNLYMSGSRGGGVEMKNGKNLFTQKFCSLLLCFPLALCWLLGLSFSILWDLRVDIKKPKNFCCCNFKYRRHTQKHKHQPSALKTHTKQRKFLLRFLQAVKSRDEVFKRVLELPFPILQKVNTLNTFKIQHWFSGQGSRTRISLHSSLLNSYHSSHFASNIYVTRFPYKSSHSVISANC